MLRELHISNLAVISDAKIELHPGLNCFTGATGAGKSLVIGAIELLLGLRSASDMLRAGADEGRVSGIFEIRDAKLMRQLETALDLPIASDGGEILLTRRIYTSGRSSISVNGQPITLTMLKTVAEALVDVHGQHDHQFLLKPSNQLDVLDEYAKLTHLRQQYHDTYTQLQAAKSQLAELAGGEKLRQQQLELYRYQAQEIDGAELIVGEYEQHSTRSSVLGNIEKLRKEAGAVHESLHDSEGSIIERLQMMSAELSGLSTVDSSLDVIATSVKEATVILSESAFDLGRYLDKLDLDPAELAEVNERLNTIHRLVKKYGTSVNDVLQKREELGRQIAQLEKATTDLTGLQKKIEPLESKVLELAGQLSVKRRVSAEKLSPLIETQLKQLGMEKAKFSVEIIKTTIGASGSDAIEFIVQTNPGLAASPLRKIASGGEIGRIMLSLKSVLAAGERMSVLVFDEIDANIGGRLGSIIGEKLRALSVHHQVLCITHLPQIACYADRHLTVRKESTGKVTNTTVRPIEGKERIEELAEMIGGKRLTDVTRSQARELFEVARQEFSQKSKPTPSTRPTSSVERTNRK